MEDVAADVKNIQQSITSMKEQLYKLNILDNLKQDVEELKQTLQFHVALVDVLKQENATLRAKVNRMNNITTELQRASFEATNNILNLQCRSMRDNIIVHGINTETYQATEQTLKTFS